MKRRDRKPEHEAREREARLLIRRISDGLTIIAEQHEQLGNDRAFVIRDLDVVNRALSRAARKLGMLPEKS